MDEESAEAEAVLENEDGEDGSEGEHLAGDEGPEAREAGEAEESAGRKKKRRTRRRARRRGPGFLLGVLMGAGAGGTLAVLFTPLTGEEARARTKEKAPELWERREELVGEARQRARAALEKAERMPGGNVINKVLGFFRSVVDRVRTAVQEGREGAAEGSEEARRRYEIMTRKRRFRS